ncbi:unnamed protein product [Orchesella dallaii]|uniref:GPI transamidase component PIG-T n=1 Tax=Orchesella dallaii TaxID=48710 RepID=A0ABP1PRN8_9HEXA
MMLQREMGTVVGCLFVLQLFHACLLTVHARDSSEVFKESLWIRSLPSGHVYANMEFVLTDLISRHDPDHSRLFPRALLEILNAHNVHELHYTLTQGYWRLHSWGEVENSAPTGAQISAWFASLNETEADNNWKGLTSRLSGLTCASLNFLDKATSVEPMYAYRPHKNIRGVKAPEKLFVRVGHLPRENYCTENLTPWTKLLPCGIMRGISSLLRSKQVFNTHYHSAAIEFYRLEKGVKLKLSLALVLDRPRNPRPQDNFARTVLGSLALFPCHLAKETNVRIWNVTGWNLISPEEINSLKVMDIPTVDVEQKKLIFTPMKYMGGYGQEYGEVIVEMTNHMNDKFLNVLYVEVLPWYIRPYLHTLRMEVTHGGQKLPVPSGDIFHYTPGQDRKLMHKLELDVSIPPKSTITAKFMVEKGHLKWDEYPPDANHGFYLPAARFEVNVTNEDGSSKSNTHKYYSRILLINLSTPDFSMPYNVICLTCTVVALAFGPIHNITTKRLQLNVVVSRKDVLKRFWSKLSRKMVDDDVAEAAGSDVATESSSPLSTTGEPSSSENKVG